MEEAQLGWRPDHALANPAGSSREYSSSESVSEEEIFRPLLRAVPEGSGRARRGAETGNKEAKALCGPPSCCREPVPPLRRMWVAELPLGPEWL